MGGSILKPIIEKLPLAFRDRHRRAWQRWRDGCRAASQAVGNGIARTLLPFRRPPFPKLPHGERYLHLGCGAINHPAFINIDARPAPHLHYISRIDRLKPFADETVDLIYASHCLEHFPYAQVPRILAEWFRVLKKNGILRLSVPDFDLLLRIYAECGNDLNVIMGALMGGQDYRYNFHFCSFTHRSLETLLKNAGFKEVREWKPGSSELTTMNDLSTVQIAWNGRMYPVSLNLEASK